MKSLTLFILLAIGSLSLYSQGISDTIQIRKSFGTQYLQHGKMLKPRNLLDIMYSDNAAYTEMLKAKDKYNLAMLLGIPGGFCFGYPIGTLIAGGTPNMTLLAVGAALTIVSVTFSISSNKHTVAAIGYYNEGLRLKGETKPSIRFGFCGQGLGMSLRF